MIYPNIVLDLSLPLNSTFPYESSSVPHNSSKTLQQDAFEQIDRLLSVFNNQAQKYDKNIYDEFNPLRSNNTIFIHGERGAGKTTFLRTLLSHYRNKDLLGRNISPLPLIDPTLIETHQHILVDIVTKFSRLVDNKLECCRDERKYQLFRGKLDEMAQGLKLLNTSNRDQKNHADGAWFLDQALNKASSGQDLEQKFHQLIDIMAEILSIDLFMLAIDDVDTNTRKADEVLEVLRRYLTHPRLVILISGDLKLYSHIVRNRKADELSSSNKAVFNSKNGEELIEHLEQQYLAKLLPLEQRVNLKKLDELCKAQHIHIQHKRLNNSENMTLDKSINSNEISNLVKTIFSDALHIKREHLQSHIDFVLSQPVRTVLQLLKTMIERASQKLPIDALVEGYDAADLKQAIYHSFVGSLVNESLKLENLTQTKPRINSIGYELFQVLHRHGELETGFYTRPDSSYDQSGYNAAKLYLSSTIATLFSEQYLSQSISNGLMLMLAGGASANIYLTYVANRLKDRFNYNNYLDYIGLNRNERIFSLAAHFSPIILDDFDPQKQRAIRSGIIRTPRKKPASFNDKNFSDFLKAINNQSTDRIKTLDSLEKMHHGSDWSFYDYVAAKTILISAHRSATTAENRDYISVYGLLAALAELQDPESNTKFERLTYIQTYAYPTFLDGKFTGNEESSIDDDSLNSVETENDNDVDTDNSKRLIELVKRWVDEQPKTQLSSLLIGKIWTRLYYSINQVSEAASDSVNYNIEGDVRKYDIVLGVLFSRFVWAVINSFLIEECRHKYDINEVVVSAIDSAKNTNTSPRELVKNLNSLISHGVDFKSYLPLTYNMITCPLFWPFLGRYLDNNGDEKSDLYERLKVVLGEKPTIRVKSRLILAPISPILNDFKKVAGESEPSKLRISSLPIMGCFRSKV